jgi:hypothetical protein
MTRKGSKDSFFGAGEIPGGRFMESPMIYAYEEENQSTNGRRELTRPMSKRDFYESIINFRTTVDSTLEDDRPSEPHLP